MLKEHLLSRHLDLELHKPVLNEQECVATFYLWNLSGCMVGFQQYRPGASKQRQNHARESRYFTYRSQPTHAVWGVESLHLTPDLVFLTEGVFDAARLTKLGVSALAVLSNNPSPDLKNWLSFLNRTVVAVCDNDAAGRALAKFGTHAEFTQDKDLGDSTNEYVAALVAKYRN